MNLALVCPELAGHLNPMLTLGRELAARGHRVSVVGSPEAQARAAAAGLPLIPISVRELESGEAAAEKAKLADMTGFAALRFTGYLLRKATEIGLRDVPPALEANGIDGVVVDQVSPAGAAAADKLNLPYVIACNALAMHQEPAVPPPVTTWPHRVGTLARWRNRAGNLLLRVAAGGIYRTIDRYREAHRLPRMTPDAGLAQVAQQPAFFDFPREQLPEHFHYTGPWHAAGRDAVEFPWDTLDGRPLIYASLGTLQNGLRHVFRAILDGCAGLPVQVVLSLGRADARWDEPVPANAVVVPFAPQLAVIARAVAVITHAGLNTALETLAAGKPMLCLPVTNDQPGVAARVAYLGAGEVLSPNRATADRVRAAVTRLLDGPHRATAETLAKRMADGPGVRHAADVVERALTTRTRVRRT